MLYGNNNFQKQQIKVLFCAIIFHMIFSSVLLDVLTMVMFSHVLFCFVTFGHVLYVFLNQGAPAASVIAHCFLA